jgi:hypothetical protein
MSFELFKRIVEQLPAGVKKVYLMKQGEPFIHTDLERFIAYLREKRPGMNISLHTNGILAAKERVAAVLPNVNSMAVSIGAISRETYVEAHGTDRFEAVQRNLQDISELLAAMEESSRPHVFIDYVCQEVNRHEDQAEVVAFYKDRYPGLASVDFHWLYNYQGEIEEGNLEVYERLQQEHFPCCVFPWSSVTFCWDGKVSYCFVEPREARFLGDITDQSWGEIWNGEEYRRFREAMAAKRFDVMAKDGFYCNRCSWLWSMKSQSPNNLAGGYALEFGENVTECNLGDILDMSAHDVMELSANYFLQGEIHKAIGCLSVVKRADHAAEVQDAASQMLALCAGVLDKYHEIPLWHRALAEEGKAVEQRKCRYFTDKGRRRHAGKSPGT